MSMAAATARGGRGGQNQGKGTGGSHRDGAAIGGHGVLGLAGEDPEHGGKHDVNHVAEDGDTGDEAGHGDGILRALGPHSLEDPVHDVVDAARLIHEHAQHHAQASNNPDRAQSGTEITGDTGRYVRNRGEIFRRPPARVGGQGQKTGAVSAHQKGNKGVEFNFDDTQQQNRYGDQKNQ